ncbi:MAG TPA: RIP metalloprotease RseP [Stenotrophobium sp.]|jgi:regulator of sigma E protease|nr:RIP metalloprotease RseP [Stenotrophobium sp.]
MLEFAWSVGGFIVAIGVLVSFHEYGHYWVARRCGVKVLRYSLGFGKPLWTHIAKDGVEWSISAIPLGGYVKMLDEREGEVAASERHLAFNTQPLLKRAAIVVAGPLFNFLLAMLFYWIVFVAGVQGLKSVIAAPPPASLAAKAGLHAGERIVSVAGVATPTWQPLRVELINQALAGGQMPLTVQDQDGSQRQLTLDLHGVRVDPEYLFDDLGLSPYQPDIPPLLAEVMPGSPAASAGFKAQDLLLSYNGVALHSWLQWATWLRAHPGEVAKVQVRRGQDLIDLTVIIGKDEQGTGKFGARVAVPDNLWQDLRAEERLAPLPAVPAAIRYTSEMSWLTLKMLWRMVLGDVSVKNISGPIQIAEVAGFSAQVGLVPFLAFMAIVSVSLGVLNLLPVPMLDGGHLFFYAIEAVKGSPLSESAQEAGQRVGLTLLVALMGLAFYNDIMRLLS